jgi:tricorn protease
MDSLNYPNFIYAQSDQLLAVPLRSGLGPPWNKAAPRTAGPVRIDLDGFEQRAVLLRVPKGSFSNLAVAQGGSLLYVHSGLQGEPSVRRVDFEQVRGNPRQVEPKTIVAGVDGFRMSEDGRKLLVQRDGAWQFLDVAGDAKPGERLNLSGMTVTVEPRSEWRQIYTEAWRMYRDFFYDPGMHGLDWPAVREKYRPMLEACASRDDVNYVLAEMLAELNSSHVIPSAPGDTDDPADPGVRRLGVDFALDRGAYRIARIYDGAPWATEYRSPLRMPGVDVREGDYLLAVNGKPIDVRKDPWAALVGLPEGPITLRVRRGLDPATVREVTVATTPGEHALRYHAFLEAKRAHVERRTGGRVGYILLTDTIDHGMRSFGRQFFAQSDKQALIIDGRWNEGGHHPDRFIEMLDRPLFYYNRTQHGRDVPSSSHTRDLPKCLLINGASLSGGDSLPYFFRKRGLGKLIGTRTTGALRGAGGATPSFIDGGRFEVPHMGLFSAEGEWVVEGEGVPPDIEVEDDPSKMRGGADPQLDAAIALMRAELRKRPATPPKPGTPPPAGRRDRATRTR